MKRINLNSIAFLLSLITLVSCNSNKVYDEYQSINTDGWLLTDTIAFEVEVSANERVTYNYLIGLRNNNEYLFSNLFLFVEIENPLGQKQVDTLQYLLAEPDGKWKGAGVGAIKSNLFEYKKSQTMAVGVYKFKIAHGMRSKILVGLEDVGLRIESIK